MDNVNKQMMKILFSACLSMIIVMIVIFLFAPENRLSIHEMNGANPVEQVHGAMTEQMEMDSMDMESMEMESIDMDEMMNRYDMWVDMKSPDGKYSMKDPEMRMMMRENGVRMDMNMEEMDDEMDMMDMDS